MIAWLAAAALAEAPAVREVHRSEVDVVTPYAEVLAEPAPAYARCPVKVVVGADGVPVSATPKEDCAEPLASKAAEAAMQGRWKLREGQAAPLAFVVPVEALPLVTDHVVSIHLDSEPFRTREILALGDAQCLLRARVGASDRVEALTFRDDACPEPLRTLLQSSAPSWTASRVADAPAGPVFVDTSFAVQARGAVLVRHTDVRVKRRTVPAYPAAARASYAGREVDCKLRVFVDEAGKPYELEFESCPEPFRDSARSALMDWRWYPVTVEDQTVKVQFLLNVKYKLE